MNFYINSLIKWHGIDIQLKKEEDQMTYFYKFIETSRIPEFLSFNPNIQDSIKWREKIF